MNTLYWFIVFYILDALNKKMMTGFYIFMNEVYYKNFT